MCNSLGLGIETFGTSICGIETLGIDRFGKDMFGTENFGTEMSTVGILGSEAFDSELWSCFCNNFLNFLAHALNTASFLCLSSLSSGCCMEILVLHEKSQLGIPHRFCLLVMIVQLLLRQMVALWHIATCTRPMGVLLLVVVQLWLRCCFVHFGSKIDILAFQE
jgi:hypothetical protein